MTPPIIFLVAAVIAVGLALLVVIALTRGRASVLNQAKYRESWLKIENNLDKNNLATFQFAILSADKLLDQALRESGVSGDTMGDRLKNSGTKFSKIDQIWTAHKLRNKIAHEPDAKISPIFLRKSLATFKQALKELGAI